MFFIDTALLIQVIKQWNEIFSKVDWVSALVSGPVFIDSNWSELSYTE